MFASADKWYYAPRVQDGEDIREPYPGEEAQFYGVYERIQSNDPLDEGHLLSEWRADFHNEEDAKAFVDLKNGLQHTPEPPVVVLGMEGGVLQWAVADKPVIVINLGMDTGGFDDGKIVTVRSVDGKMMEVAAHSGITNVDINPQWVEQVNEALHEAAATNEARAHEKP